MKFQTRRKIYDAILLSALTAAVIIFAYFCRRIIQEL